MLCSMPAQTDFSLVGLAAYWHREYCGLGVKNAGMHMQAGAGMIRIGLGHAGRLQTMFIAACSTIRFR
jgi:hypothetical protein